MKISFEISDKEYRKLLNKLINTQGALWILDIIQRGINENKNT